jgi:hypothetical protein
MEDSSEIDLIIEQIKDDSISTTTYKEQPPKEPTIINDENVSTIVYDKTAELLDHCIDVVKDLKNTIIGGADPKEVSAAAQFINSTTKLIDTLNKVNIQKRQEKADIEMEKIRADATKALGDKPINNNFLVAGSREDIMKMLDRKPEKKVIDI